jgi:hypothetical protein
MKTSHNSYRKIRIPKRYVIKIKQKLKQVVVIIIGITVLFLVTERKVDVKADQTSCNKPEKVTEVTASKILNDYWNADTAKEFHKVENKYKGKQLKVTGKIKSIKSESIDGAYIILKNSNPVNRYSDCMTVQCIFKDFEDIENLKKGKKVSIIGDCLGSDGIVVVVYDCKLDK